MRFITADKIHNGLRWLPKGSVLEIDGTGKIQAVHQAGKIAQERVQTFKGTICPGFVNTHCHIELSHLKGQVEEDQGLVSFLSSVTRYAASFSQEQKTEAARSAIVRLKENGIVAVGDISNGKLMVTERPRSGLHIHTFVESLGFLPEQAQSRFAFSLNVYDAFRDNSVSYSGHILRQSISPHAPYSNSEALFSLIDKFDPGSLLSIHNQECLAENELFRNQRGSFFDFYKNFPLDISQFKASGKSSLQTYLPWLSRNHQILLVHNTFTDASDIEFLEKNAWEISICLCPNANWFIENRLPPLKLFLHSKLNVCIGTDSLASNHDLSILDELRLIRKNYPEIPWETLLRWATWNGAIALQMQDLIGSIEPGKRPGLVHLIGEDYEKLEVVA